MELDCHLRADKPCNISKSSDRPSQSINPAQMSTLRRRNGLQKGNEVERWFQIWEILFPDRPRPCSPCRFLFYSPCSFHCAFLVNLWVSSQNSLNGSKHLGLAHHPRTPTKQSALEPSNPPSMSPGFHFTEASYALKGSRMADSSTRET